MATRYRDAIARIESGGRYNAVGPTHPKMGRALGRYQVMESNIGPWAREALGREVSADEFLSNPEIQDAVFDHRFGQYVQRFGPEGAAQAWFGGEGGVGKTGRKDVLGTSVGKYGDMFMAGLGEPVGPSPSSPAGGARAASEMQPPGNGPMPASPFSIPSDVAAYAARDEDKKSPLKDFFSALAKTPDAPTGHLGGGGDARGSGGLLAEVLQNPNAIAMGLLKKRMGGLLG